MKRTTKAFAGVAIATLTTLTLATPAFAEGSWSSSMSNVRVGFESRRWADKNSDAAGTIVSLRYCSGYSGPNAEGDGGKFTLNLIKDTLFDEARGNVTYVCQGSTWKQYNWGRQPAGNYFFRVTNINYGGPASAGGVKVNY